MTPLLAAVLALIGSLLAQDLAWQSLHELPLRPLAGTCPRCGHPRGWLQGRCPRCRRVVGEEWVTAVVAAGAGAMFAVAIGPTWVLAAHLAFLVLTLALVVTDLHSMRIVDRLNLPGTLLVVAGLAAAAAAEGSAGALTRALLGGLAYFTGANLVFLATRGAGFGYGDVKLSFQLGVFTTFWSWGTLGWAVLLTALLGGLVSLLVLAFRLLRGRGGGDEPGQGVRAVMKTELPYGPVMVAGAWTAIILAGLGALPLPT